METARSRDIYFLNDRRRQQLREDPTIVLRDDARKISLLLEYADTLHLAFGLIEEDGRPPRERAASGATEDFAIKGIGEDIYRLYLRDGHSETVENMHRTGRVPRRYRMFKADSF